MSQAMLSLLLVATCAATVLAQLPPSPQHVPPFPTIPAPLSPEVTFVLPTRVPGLPPQGNLDERAECWSSLQQVPGCVWKIYTTIFSGKFSVGPACCKAFLAVSDKCLLEMFPQLPSILPLIKTNCGQAKAGLPNPVGSKLKA